MIRAAALALLLAVSSDNPDAMQRLRDWVLAVDEHQAGERDTPLRSIGAWTYDDADMMRAYVEALVEAPTDERDRATRRRQISRNDLGVIRERTKELRARGDFDRFLKRAAILHTDLALLTFVPEAVEPPMPGRQQPRQNRSQSAPAVDVMGFDGRVEDFRRANPHWDFASDVLEALPSKPERDPFVGQWFSTIAAHFARRDNTADGMRHFAKARRIVPDHPDVLYAWACLQEKMGAPRIQDFARVAVLPNGLTILGVYDPKQHFRDAEDMLRKALAARPDFPAASLRLGHVLAEKREFEAAITVLQAVIPKLDDTSAFYAHLFSGDAALALGRDAESRASYERALKLFPGSQSARLGLGAAYRYSGDRQGALDAMQFTLQQPQDSRDSRDEPWWDYYEGDEERVEQLLAELRAPFTNPR